MLQDQPNTRQSLLLKTNTVAVHRNVYQKDIEQENSHRWYIKKLRHIWLRLVHKKLYYSTFKNGYYLSHSLCKVYPKLLECNFQWDKIMHSPSTSSENNFSTN